MALRPDFVGDVADLDDVPFGRRVGDEGADARKADQHARILKLAKRAIGGRPRYPEPPDHLGLGFDPVPGPEIAPADAVDHIFLDRRVACLRQAVTVALFPPAIRRFSPQ
jgi:hypothetical protein